MQAQKKEEESEPKENFHITGINRTMPDSTDHYGVEIKTKRKYTIYYRHRLSSYHHAIQQNTKKITGVTEAVTYRG